jgi:hypothetical protein
MVIGHYATAYAMKPHVPAAPMWLLLLCANLLDAIWLLLAGFGYETPVPNSWLEASYSSLRVQMPYSHDLLPALGWAVLVFYLVAGLFRQWKVGLACALLIVGHEALDLLAGFEHNVAGPSTRIVGTGLYTSAPYLSFLLEAAVAGVCVAWYCARQKRSGAPVSASRKRWLYVFFVGSALIWFPIGHTSLMEWIRMI